MIFATGIVFQLPSFVFALMRLRPRILTSAQLCRNRKIGYEALLGGAILPSCRVDLLPRRLRVRISLLDLPLERLRG